MYIYLIYTSFVLRLGESNTAILSRNAIYNAKKPKRSVLLLQCRVFTVIRISLASEKLE